jgi:hypothetical protein
MKVTMLVRPIVAATVRRMRMIIKLRMRVPVINITDRLMVPLKEISTAFQHFADHAAALIMELLLGLLHSVSSGTHFQHACARHALKDGRDDGDQRQQGVSQSSLQSS